MPVTPPAAARPSGSLLQPFPNPAVPLRSSASAALNDFLAHHTEDIASALELCAAQAVHKVTKDNLEAAQAAHIAAEARVAEANRAHLSDAVVTLVSMVVSSHPSGPDDPVKL